MWFIDDQGSNDKERRGSLSKANIPRFVDIYIHVIEWGVCVLKVI